MSQTPVNRWDTSLYDDRHHFVTDFGAELITLLAPLPGERVLDLGCGTGHLTQRIAASGALVTGLDSAESMIAQARENYPDLPFVVGRGEDFAFDQPFDAVFSNAALHWMPDAPAVARCIARALQPGGRLVAEFGGWGNITRLWGGLCAAFEAVGLAAPVSPWYFPSLGEYATLLEAHGFRVAYAAHFPRYTPLEGEDGLRNWLMMFANGALAPLPESLRQQIFDDVEKRLRPALHTGDGWHADYVRLRVLAYKEHI
jgi:trans-aconitate methyltransferase